MKIIPVSSPQLQAIFYNLFKILIPRKHHSIHYKLVNHLRNDVWKVKFSKNVRWNFLSLLFRFTELFSDFSVQKSLTTCGSWKWTSKFHSVLHTRVNLHSLFRWKKKTNFFMSVTEIFHIINFYASFFYHWLIDFD